MQDESNQWHSVAHSMPTIGRQVLFYFPAVTNYSGEHSEKIEKGKILTPDKKGYGIISRISCDTLHQDITHWAEIGTEGVPIDDGGFIFEIDHLRCINPIEIQLSKNSQKSKIIEVAQLGDYWFYGLDWNYDGIECSCVAKSCSPHYWTEIGAKNDNRFKTKEEAIQHVLHFFQKQEEQKNKKVTKQISLF